MISRKRTRPIKPQIKNSGNSIDATPLSKRQVIKNWLFFFVWLYFIIRVFFTDIDLLVAKEFGLNNTVLYLFLRILVVTILTIILWFKVGNLRFWKNIGLLFLFPIYPISWLFFKKMLWSIPKYLYKRDYQLLLYYYLDSIIDFFVDFKHIVLRNTLLVLAFIGIFTFNGYWFIVPILLFGVLLIMHLAQRFKQTFSPIKLFRLNLDNIESASEDSFTPEKIEENFTKSADKKVSRHERLTKQVEHYLILNESLKALKIKLKYIQNNRIYMVSFIGRTVMSVVICAIYFTGMNYGLYKLNPNNFDSTTKLYFIDFFECSFYSIFPEGIGISPTSDIARVFRMFGTFTGILLNVFLFIFYMTVSNERQKENLDRMLNYTTERSHRFETYFKEKYGKTPSEGIDWIKSRGSQIESILNEIRRRINPKK